MTSTTTGWAVPDEPAYLHALPPIDDEPDDVGEDLEGDQPPSPDLVTTRSLFLVAYRELAAAGGRQWDNATEEERAAFAMDLVAMRAGLVESLARAGFTGPDALTRYLEITHQLERPLRERDGRDDHGRHDGQPSPVTPSIDDEAVPWIDAPAWRTLADVPDDPPGALMFGMLEPAGPTLGYAAPGVGKGSTGAWVACEAQAAGMLPVIYDAERRPREWARRISGLGGDRSRVVYIEPADLGPKLAGRPFWEIGEAVGSIVRAAGGDLFLLDSLLPASGIGEERLRSDAQSPFLFVSALDGLGVPSLSFGHPPKGQPEGDPFGSMAWLAAFRLTWLGTKAEGDGHRVRWRPRKRNERGHVPGILLAFAYGTDSRLCGVTREDDEESTRDWILAALVHGPRTVGALAEELLEDAEEPPTDDRKARVKQRLGQALLRMKREGWVTKEGNTGASVRWHLRLEDAR